MPGPPSIVELATSPLQNLVPELWIDWGCDLHVGSRLLPEFHLLCPGFHSLPSVTVHLDQDLDQQDWREVARLHLEGDSHWSFDEPLRLTTAGGDCRPGVYRLELRAVFREGTDAAPRCFLGRIPIRVRAPGQQVGPTLEIEGEDACAVNMMGLDLHRFATIRMKGKGEALINIQEALYPAAGADAGREPQSQPYVVKVALKPDPELERHLPRPSRRGRRQELNAAALVFPQGQRTLLLAKSSVELGRNRNNDVVLRLWPRPTDDYREVSRRISGKHLRLLLTPDGLLVEDDHSSCGTYLSGETLRGPYLIAPPDRHARVFAVAGVLGLEVTCHRDPVWRELPGCHDLIEEQYRRVLAGSTPLWPLARRAGWDAARIRRRTKLAVREHLAHLAKRMEPADFQLLERAAQRINLIDGLAEREQYVLVFRTATLGGDETTDPICLPGSGLCGAHARVLHLEGVFWLEALLSDGRIGVEGEPLPAHEPVPLAPGMQLQLGRTTATFDVFQQPEL